MKQFTARCNKGTSSFRIRPCLRPINHAVPCVGEYVRPKPWMTGDVCKHGLLTKFPCESCDWIEGGAVVKKKKKSAAVLKKAKITAVPIDTSEPPVGIGDVWRRYGLSGQDVVTVLHVELNFVCVEFRDKKYPYGGNHREWWPRGWFTMKNQLMRRQARAEWGIQSEGRSIVTEKPVAPSRSKRRG